MLVCKRDRASKPLSMIATGLGSVFKPDLVVPETMLAILKSLDLPPAYMVAATNLQKPVELSISLAS